MYLEADILGIFVNQTANLSLLRPRHHADGSDNRSIAVKSLTSPLGEAAKHEALNRM